MYFSSSICCQDQRRSKSALPLIYTGVAKRKKDKAMEVLEMVNLTDRSHHKPNEMSGGQCQRVAIARALVKRSAIILADEPTGNLDSKTSYEIMDIFKKFMTMVTRWVLVTHEEDIAKYSQKNHQVARWVVESDRAMEMAELGSK